MNIFFDYICISIILHSRFKHLMQCSPDMNIKGCVHSVGDAVSATPLFCSVLLSIDLVQRYFFSKWLWRCHKTLLANDRVHKIYFGFQLFRDVIIHHSPRHVSRRGLRRNEHTRRERNCMTSRTKNSSLIYAMNV